MKQQIDLNGRWKAAWSQHEGNTDKIPVDFNRPGATHAAVVPGDVHVDLMREGMLPDVFVGKNLLEAAWMEDKDWWFTRTFATPPRHAHERVLLVFHGLDTYGTIYLNGEVVGRTENMHRRYTFDVTEKLREAGENELTVRLASPRYMIPFDPAHTPLIWSPERLFARKAQMSFGWDIAPRLLTRGIWRPVELVIVDEARIGNVFVVPESLDDGPVVTVRVRVEVERLECEAALRVTGQVHGVPFSAALSPWEQVVNVDVRIPDAPRWWPIGYGEPALVDVEVSVCAGDRQLDAVQFRTGLRTVELVQEPVADGKRSFRFRVNGSDLFVTGFNWTPLDAIFARVTPEQITRRLEEVAGVGANMLRVWGGGIYEPDHFFAECDRLGILVWQDFMMACGWYPQTDWMAAAMEGEARQVVRDLRNHPCLALWAGDNENDGFYPELALKNRLTRKVLAGVCAELHPQIPYLPSSPYRPTELPKWSEDREGDTHAYAHGSNYRESWMWKLRPRFMSEFGHLSLPGLETIRAYFPAGSEWPLDNALWRYHGTDTIESRVFRWTDCVLRSLHACGKPAPDNIEEAVAASQELHSEAMLALIDHYNQNPEFAGFLLWNVHDCWPQMSDAVIDYQGHPKRIFARLGPVFAKLREEHRGANTATQYADCPHDV